MRRQPHRQCEPVMVMKMMMTAAYIHNCYYFGRKITI